MKKPTTKIILFFIISLFFYLPFSIAQKGDALNELGKYETAKNAIFLLKNAPTEGQPNQHDIPLMKMGKNELGILCLHCAEANTFVEVLEKYQPVEVFDFEKKNINDFGKWAAGKQKILLVFDKKRNEKNDLASFLRQTEMLTPNILKKTILVIFAEQNLEQQKETFEQFPTVVFAKKINSWTPSLVAQSIFGAIPMRNNQGKIMTIGGLRLGYAPPEIEGMNSAFLEHKIDSIAKVSIELGAFPGMQVLVAKGGNVVFHKAYGYHTYDNKKNVQLTDLYDFASLSKITTALPALMKLHSEGKFDIDQPLKTYFPKFKKSNKSNLIYRDILAHQAGLQPWIPYWKSTIKKNGKYKWRTFKTKYSKRYNVKITDHLFLHRKYKKRIYKAICKSPVSNDKTYKYSGLAFYLFPKIISDLTHSDFETYLKKNIYEPLGAYTLTYNPLRFFPLDRIIPTERDTFFRHVQIHGTVHDEGAIMMGGVSSNAGLFGTANDLAKLAQMYLNKGTYAGQRFIAEKTLEEFTKCQFPENNNKRGLGFDKPLLEYDAAKSSVAKSASASSYGHSGYTGTFVWIDPKYDLIYIFFSNRVYPTRNNRKLYILNIRPQIHQAIYDSFLK